MNYKISYNKDYNEGNDGTCYRQRVTISELSELSIDAINTFCKANLQPWISYKPLTRGKNYISLSHHRLVCILLGIIGDKRLLYANTIIQIN